MKISFVNFWRNDMEKTDWGKIFIRLINLNKNNLLHKNIVVFSVFKNINNININKYKESLKIFYTGENPERYINTNIENFYNKFDIVLSFEKNHIVKKEHNYKHVRLTIWMLIILSLNNWEKDFLPEKKVFMNNILKYYSTSKTENAIIICRHDRNKIRGKICNDFMNITNVNIHSAGAWKTNVKKCGKGSNHRIIKLTYIQKYKFNICPENSKYSGYNTEKLLDTLITGGIPIYWGDTIEEEYFNKEKIILYDSNFKTRLLNVINNIESYQNLAPFKDNFYDLIKQKEDELKEVFINSHKYITS